MVSSSRQAIACILLLLSTAGSAQSQSAPDKGPTSSISGKITVKLNNVAPGRYWILAHPAIDDGPSPLTKLRLPDGTETRLTFRGAAEAAKNEIEFKPCQNVVDFRLKL